MSTASAIYKENTVAISKRTIQKFNKLYETVLAMKLHIEELASKQVIEEAAIKHPKKVGRPKKAKR